MADEDAEYGKSQILEEKGLFIKPSELFCNIRKNAENDENLNVTLFNTFNNIESSAQGTNSEADVKGLFASIDVNSNKLGETVPERNENFKKLLDEIEKQILLGNIKDKVIVQAGYTKYSSKNMEIVDLMDMNRFSKLIKSCDLLITHGGVGTILDGIKNSKKIIAFPRLSKFHEHVNDHQIQIIDEFYSNGYILTGEIRDLDKLLVSIKDFIPKSYKSNNQKFNKLIEDYINNI